MEQHLSNLANLATIAALILPVAVVGGLVPRAGPGRAIVLALRSRFRSADTASLRTNAMRTLRAMLVNVSKSAYIVVTGQKGVGKTVVVDSVTQKTCGVLSVAVAPGTPQDTIVTKVLSEVANSRLGFFDPRGSARRVLWFYSLFLPRPIVILRAGERRDGQDFADVPGAARELAVFGLRVLVDGSTNSLPVELLKTTREDVLDLGGMSWDELSSIPENAGVFGVLRTEGLEGLAWAVLGGVPSRYSQLAMQLKRTETQDSRRVIVSFLRNEIGSAISCCDRTLAACPAMRLVFDAFKDSDAVPESMLSSRGIVAPSPNKVLRASKIDGRVMLVPADPATALVLRCGLFETPAVEELLRLVKGAYGGARGGPLAPARALPLAVAA